MLTSQESPVTGMCTGGALGPAHDQPGVVCEDFDTDRNGSGSIEWHRLFPAAPICDPLRMPEDPADDILGGSINGGPTPFGVAGSICSDDAQFAAARQTCHPVPSENDWHLHSPFEGCDTDDSYDLGDPQFASSCAPGPHAHSGFRSLHLGRHLNATDTIWDTYRWRQTSAFVMDPVHLGTVATLEFWQIIRVCDDLCIGGSNGSTTAGGQIHLSARDDVLGIFEPWVRLDAVENPYGSVDQNMFVLCEFDPSDDFLPPGNETMCGGQYQWSEQGDAYGTDLSTCSYPGGDTDGDGTNPNGDCGQTTNRTVDPNCSWVADPNCASYLEHGSSGPGVWARTRFDLSPFAGREARIRWIFEGGGGWGFGESRSFSEPEVGLSPYFAFEKDDGWFVDDIRITDVLESIPVCADPDGDGFGTGGNAACSDGIQPDCDCSDAGTFPGATEICDRLDNDCDMVLPADELDGDGDALTSCEGDCNDADAANIITPPPPTGLLAMPGGNSVALSWDDQAAVSGSDTVFDIFTGLVSDLRSGTGFSAGKCEKNNQTSTSYTVHGPDPPPGDMRYWIIRGQNGCPAGDGSWGSPTRDAEVPASTMACD
jgi:hypothetical protein